MFCFMLLYYHKIKYNVREVLMIKLDLLFKVAEDENVVIEYIKLPRNILGLYYKGPDLPPSIGINRNIVNDSPLFTSVLAEELGHHFTTVFDTSAECFSYRDKLLINKVENLALRWATNFVIPNKELVQALKAGITTVYDLAEYFTVTEDFIKQKFYFVSLDEKLNTSINIELLKEVNYDCCNI